MTSLLFVLLILFAIGLHEFGHFITAKKFGMKVDRFFIGFGPKLWSTTRGETEYGFNWIPAGGYVRIAGMNPFEEIAPEDRDRVFKAKKPWQRAIVLAAGSVTHFLLAFVVLAGLLMVGIKDGPPTTRINSVDTGTPAYAAGFEPGDQITMVGGTSVTTWEQIREAIRARPGEPLTFQVRRDGALKTLTPTIASENPQKEKVGFLGVGPEAKTVKRSFGDAFVQSGKGLGIGMKESLVGMGKIVSPATFKRLILIGLGREERQAGDPTSIVGVTRAAGSSGLENLIVIFIGFNIFVGVANLMPLPPLDGGHLAVLAYEKIRGKSVDMRKLIPLTATVLVVLVSLFVLATFADIVQPPIPG